MQTEKLTLRGWSLNAARILDRMIDKIETAGGHLVDTWPFTVIPRLYEVKDEYLPGSPVLTLRVRSYLSFVLDENYIYVQLGQNPMLDMLYVKEHTDGKAVSVSPEGKELPWCWYVTEDVYAHLDDEQVDKAAESLLTWLQNAELTQKLPAEKRRKIRRKEVQNVLS